ncbi:MAG: SUMF1/EgtB/PvdO family nonheme iron enzyme [Prevotellaceae bacterium]|jgi:formylglycine-generating enzyme required for sulfatase activity/serine/threonine protein kinase|nr:SUMF1/EgtB/PvdO family nonheme iron enzyme [Prevotellaceae bacterium]
MQLKENTLFHSRYRLIKLLGRGGFSEVWLAEDSRTGIKVALKVYAPGTGLDENGVQLFSREFSLVFGFNHSNLLRTTYYDICEKMPYLIMPYCERGSTAKLVGRISEEEAWKFLHDVAAGLAYLHGQEPPVIHQDIKPDNILVDDGGIYLISDFGISTKARNTLRKSVIHQNSGGTLDYMGPERFGTENIPIKAGDIWALGATLFELLEGNTPFDKHGGLIQKNGAEIPEIQGNYSPELKKITTLCLQKDAWDRPMANDLIAWTEQHFRKEPVRFGNRKDKKDKSAVNKKPVPNRQPARQYEEKKSSKNYLVMLICGVAALVVLGIAAFWFLTQQTTKPTLPPQEAWLKEYYSTLKHADSIYDYEKNYSLAKAQYEEVLKTIPVTDVSNKADSVKQRLYLCDLQIQKEQEEKEQKDKESQAAQEQAKKEEQARKEEDAEREKQVQLAQEQAEKSQSGKEEPSQPSQASQTSQPSQAQASNEDSEKDAPKQQIDIQMVFVKGGVFTMGCSSEQNDCYDEEKPAHEVTLSDFNIGQYEVTQKQWVAVMGNNPSQFQGDNLPVENVNWDDARAFIKKLNALTGKKYRLPTEAEWEYAARGGAQSRGYKYSGSNNVDEVAWYKTNSDGKTHEAGSKKANELNIYDMTGNVDEWCSDWYEEYKSDSVKNPTGPASGSFRVLRGGSWDYAVKYVRIINRDYNYNDFRKNIVGLRLVHK